MLLDTIHCRHVPCRAGVVDYTTRHCHHVPCRAVVDCTYVGLALASFELGNSFPGKRTPQAVISSAYSLSSVEEDLYPTLIV